MFGKVRSVVLHCIRLALVLVALLTGVMCVTNPEYNKYGGVLAALILPFLPIFVEKLFKIKIALRLQLIYYLFLFVALFLGINMDLYKYVPHFDKAVHLVSGFLSVILGYYVLVYFKLEKSPRLFRVVFVVCFAMAIGVLWEFFEFACDKILGQSMQQLVSVGLDDTMLDLLAATVGAIVGAIWLVRRKHLKFLEK